MMDAVEVIAKAIYEEILKQRPGTDDFSDGALSRVMTYDDIDVAEIARAVIAKISEWKPIESAPKDGTVILLAGGEDDSTRDEYREFCRAPCRAVWAQGEWVMAFAASGYSAVCRNNPTHWQPLPSPPVTAREKE